jgi:AmmeMemoRadiSam system protein B
MPNITSLSNDYRPKVRSYLEAKEIGDTIVLQDTRRIGRPIGVTRLGLEIAVRMDGTRTLERVQADLLAVTGGQHVPLEVIQHLVESLDERYLLETPRFRALLDGPVRNPSHIPLEADPKELESELHKLFTAPGGAGLPTMNGQPREEPDRLRALLLPHMDYGRGNITYGFGFKELIEKSAAKIFVVIATSHYSPERFTLSRQHFATPFGTVETDLDYVDRISALYGEGLYKDVEAHIPEHSIELELIPLKLLRKERPFRIVPLLVGSFRDCVKRKCSPSSAADIAKMVHVLREVEANSTDSVCYLISGDLAHIGPKFQDRRQAAGPWLLESWQKDAGILQTLTQANPTAYFETIAAEGDARRICGLPPTWLALEVARPSEGKILHYQQYIDPTGYESVSFAAAAFYR